MAELADALDSGSNGRKAVQVQVLLPAPSNSLENTEFSRLFAFYFPLSHGGRGGRTTYGGVSADFQSLLYAIRQYHAQSNDYLDLKQ